MLARTPFAFGLRMTSRRLGLLALAMLTAFGTTGCREALQIAALSLQVAPAVVEVAVAASKASENSHESNTCCYSREDPTPVLTAVYRPMSACELERGRWREAHQDQSEVPEELHCLDNGAYPRVAPYYTAPPSRIIPGGDVDVPPPLPAAPSAPAAVEAASPPDAI